MLDQIIKSEYFIACVLFCNENIVAFDVAVVIQEINTYIFLFKDF